MRVAIVGAGVGGLAVAAKLSISGAQVQLFENNERVGGKMSTRSNEEGCEWDTGPTLLTLPQEINKTFEELDGYIRDKPLLLPLKEVTSLRFLDETAWNLPSGQEALNAYFSKINQPLAQSLNSVITLASDVFAFAEKYVLQDDPPNSALLGLKTISSGLSVRYPDLARLSYKRLVEKIFADQNMREFFFHFSSYVGIEPENAAASLISIAHVELNSPVVYPQGGVYKIATALFEACTRSGVQFFPQESIVSAEPLGKDTKNFGWKIRTTNHPEERPFDALIVNADPHRALSDWLDSPYLRRHWLGDLASKALRPSESQFVILFDRDEYSPLPHHLKIFPQSFEKSFHEVSALAQIPEDPCIYLVWPHATDPTVSPRVLFLSGMAPCLDSGHSWDESECKAYADRLLEICRRRLHITLPGKVFKTLSPMDLYRRTGSLRGGLYGAAPTRFRPFFFQRPASEKPQRLYFVGGGIHPGAGVPMVLKCARKVANRVLKQHGKDI